MFVPNIYRGEEELAAADAPGSSFASTTSSRRAYGRNADTSTPSRMVSCPNSATSSRSCKAAEKNSRGDCQLSTVRVFFAVNALCKREYTPPHWTYQHLPRSAVFTAGLTNPAPPRRLRRLACIMILSLSDGP